MKKRTRIFPALLASLLVVVFVAGFSGSLGLKRAGAAVLAANKTEILFDGDTIQGLKGFTYKVYKDRQDVRGIGANERVGLSYIEGEADEDGLVSLTMYGPGLGHLVSLMQNSCSGGRALEDIYIEGKIVVECPLPESLYGIPALSHGEFAEEAMSEASETLNKHMDNNTHLQIILSVMQDSYPEGLGIKQFTFDGCYVDDREFQITSGGHALTTYTFTADRLREAWVPDPGGDE
jgi:hypothetical protein